MLSVPVQRLTICDLAPRSIAALVYPGLRQPEKEASRVLPHRWVLSIHWTFSDPHKMPSYSESIIAELNQANSNATDRAVVRNIDMSKVQWPQGTKEVALQAFNRSLDDVPWPSGLERLWFGEPNPPFLTTYPFLDVFDKPLDGVTFPCGLREIFLGDRFDQPIEGIAWPGGLERLSLPGFNYSIRDVLWAPGLKALEFASPSMIGLWQDLGAMARLGASRLSLRQGYGRFNQVIGSILPPSIERLWLSSTYNQPLDGVAWPNGIATLGVPFYLRSNCSRGITWPSTVETIFMADDGDTEIRLPKGAKVKILDPYGERLNW